jgi:hypothetical protein
MIIRNNGIEIAASVTGNNLKYTVISQTPEATDALKKLGNVADEETGLRLRSNNYPNFNHKERMFYVRGLDNTKDNKETVAKFNSSAEAREAMHALDRLVDKVTKPERMMPAEGGTTHVRMALISKSQAQKLKLSAKNHYPDKHEWSQSKAIKTVNTHYNEHIGQVVDVLNKSLGKVKAEMAEGVVNPHKVCSDDARYAVEQFRKLFSDAEKAGDGKLVAIWRLVSGVRGPDFVDERPEDISDNDHYEEEVPVGIPVGAR